MADKKEFGVKYSIIVAVYNRPDEMMELLDSLARQTFKDFEVVVVEDGSTLPSDAVCQQWQPVLSIVYFTKENGGPGPARNFGCSKANGEVLLFLDSDCTVPESWLAIIDKEMIEGGLDAFGGPDKEHESFSITQKAISYAMTSVLTTGGIRGLRIRTGGSFHPRSFNMGMKKEVFTITQGFAAMRFGEDIDLSIRMINAGFTVGLIPDAWVYHKRRTDFRKFYRQVFNSGNARITLSMLHPGTLKLTHFFPTAITVYFLFAVFYSLAMPGGWATLLPLCLYYLMVFVHASLSTKSLSVGLVSVLASLIQLTGYGLGFCRGLWFTVILGRKQEYAFKKTYYQ